MPKRKNGVLTTTKPHVCNDILAYKQNMAEFFENLLNMEHTKSASFIPIVIIELISEYLLPDTRIAILKRNLHDTTLAANQDPNLKVSYNVQLFDSMNMQKLDDLKVDFDQFHVRLRSCAHSVHLFSIECATILKLPYCVLPIGLTYLDQKLETHIFVCPQNQKSYRRVATLKLDGPRPVHDRSQWDVAFGFLTEHRILILYTDQEKQATVWSFANEIPVCRYVISYGYAYTFGLLYNPLRIVLPFKVFPDHEDQTILSWMGTGIFNVSDALSKNRKSPIYLSPTKDSALVALYGRHVTILGDGTIALWKDEDNPGRLSLFPTESKLMTRGQKNTHKEELCKFQLFSKSKESEITAEALPQIDLPITTQYNCIWFARYWNTQCAVAQLCNGWIVIPDADQSCTVYTKLPNQQDTNAKHFKLSIPKGLIPDSPSATQLVVQCVPGNRLILIDLMSGVYVVDVTAKTIFKSMELDNFFDLNFQNLFSLSFEPPLWNRPHYQSAFPPATKRIKSK
jgi:hypothetical protein